MFIQLLFIIYNLTKSQSKILRLVFAPPENLRLSLCPAAASLARRQKCDYILNVKASEIYNHTTIIDLEFENQHTVDIVLGCDSANPLGSKCSLQAKKH